ncbi:MAG: hypothetical protein NLN64_03110 [Candidatus Thalassarchaeaceae archaeon]|nr:hypothetical protein [Candidatus Thalassarchaeaceae archaeon]
MVNSYHTVFNPAFYISFILILMSFSGILIIEDEFKEPEELSQINFPLYAASPGHAVFGEYVGAHWCGPCMSSASPSLDNLKTSNPEDFTFVSFFESNSGWPSTSPIDRADHIMDSSTGYPTFAFADQQSGQCYKVGASGTNYYDSTFSNGGCMDSNSNDFSLELLTSLDTSTEQVSVSLNVTYLGTLSSISVYVYGAITEKIGADAYDNGARPHHNWREWLLNDDQDGFTEISLSPNNYEILTWEVSLDVVRSAGGNSQIENFWPVFAIMDGPHSSFNSFITAVDLDMGPLIDLGVSQIAIVNEEGISGFQSGDILDISVEILNHGVDSYSQGGLISIYLLDGSEEINLGSVNIEDLSIGGTQEYDLQFDSSDISISASGSSVFRAIISDMEGDRVASNNYADSSIFHDMPPIAIRPTSLGSSIVERGDNILFESSALSNDLVDDMSTMQPILQHSESSISDWSEDWVTDIYVIGEGQNSRYVHNLNSDMEANTGSYDIRISWQDTSGQLSEWLIVEDIFELTNSLPKVLENDDEEFVGIPTVKVDIIEEISIIGLIGDAETDLSGLTVSSTDSEFISWNPNTLKISVKFHRVITDNGNPVPQGIFVSIDDGEDTNNGMLMFNVIENGAPKWAPISTNAINEGGSTSFSLTQYLSDTDNQGNYVSTSDLDISIVSVSNDSLVEASISGQSITVSTIDLDSYGITNVTIRANDGEQYSDTIISFHVININDPPSINLSKFNNLEIKINEITTINILDSLSDIDDPAKEIWASISKNSEGSLNLNPASGELSLLWSEIGEKIIEITVTDRHGASTASSFTIDVLSNKIITWEGDGDMADLSVSYDTIGYKENPVFQINNIGNLQLSQIKITWTICNSITGICHSHGIVNSFGSFTTMPQNGGGLVNGDYITLEVAAIDSEGWLRESSEILKIFAQQPDSDRDGIQDSDDEFPNNPSESKDSDGDGVGDNSDVFPFDSSEWQDMDGNGVGDNIQYSDGQSLPGFSISSVIISIICACMVVRRKL